MKLRILMFKVKQKEVTLLLGGHTRKQLDIAANRLNQHGGRFSENIQFGIPGILWICLAQSEIY